MISDTENSTEVLKITMWYWPWEKNSEDKFMYNNWYNLTFKIVI